MAEVIWAVLWRRRRIEGVSDSVCFVWDYWTVSIAFSVYGSGVARFLAVVVF